MARLTARPADPVLTLRVYAHAIPEDEPDMAFADFDAPGRPYTAPVSAKRVTAGRKAPERLAPPG